MTTEIVSNLRALVVNGPAQRRRIVDSIPRIESRPSLEEKLDHLEMIPRHSMVQRSRVRMESFVIVPVRILAGIEQQAHYIGASKLRRQAEGDMPAPAVGVGK